MLAVATKQPLFQITAGESVMLSDSVIGVAEQYSVVINPKALAWFNLLAAACAVYAPKAMMVMMSQPKRVVASQPAAPGSNVIDLTGGAGMAPPVAGGKLDLADKAFPPLKQ